MNGILRMTFFKDVIVLSGQRRRWRQPRLRQHALPRPPRFFADKQWAGIDDWETVLQPHYDTAEYMLGVNRGAACTSRPTT